jgi:4,4'-diaponeurosporenoate glycosyltransferase
MGSDTLILIVAMLAWLSGFILLRRVRMVCGTTSAACPQASVSIVIPARDEALNLPVLLRSINAQSARPLEVIVVDDASTDRTADAATQLGAIVVSSQPLPTGWRGKTWACQQGANQARGDILLFLDADTWFEKDGLPRILAEYDGGALSVGPYHLVRSPHEQLSAFFNLVMNVSTIPQGLFGQMLLVEKESYRRVGGHEGVKSRILENCFLAEHFVKVGIRTRSLAGKGVFSVRMYPNGIGELVEGWTKGFASGARQTPKPMLLLIVVWLTGMILPVGLISHSPWASLLYLAFAAQVGFLFHLVGAFRWYTALLYPAPLVFYFMVFALSALRSGRPVKWKGRSFHVD